MLTLGIFIALVGMIMIGVPVFAAMGLTAAGTFVYLGEGSVLSLMPQRMYVATTGYTLLAIPFFILAGNLMNSGGITLRIFRFARVSCGYLRGGLGYVNIVAAMIFSGMCGSAVAEAAGLGLVSIKAMTDNGYDKEFAAGITAASSTIGPVIPPSIPAVIYGGITGVSVVKLFMAGVVPGVLMGGTMMVAVYFISKKRNYPKDPFPPFREITAAFLDSVLALFMPVLIIGGILSGIFTPTEAAFVSAVYALVVGGLVYHNFTLPQLYALVWDSIAQSVRVLFIIATAGFFGWLMIHQSIPEQVITGMTAISGNKYVLLLIVIFILLILGCFMEGIAVILITVPVFMKLVEQFQIDPVQFGMVVILCSMIGLLTPPVGMSLYAVCTISGVPLGRLSREVIPYLIGILAVTLAIAFIPEVATWLPNLLIPD